MSVVDSGTVFMGVSFVMGTSRGHIMVSPILQLTGGFVNDLCVYSGCPDVDKVSVFVSEYVDVRYLAGLAGIRIDRVPGGATDVVFGASFYQWNDVSSCVVLLGDSSGVPEEIAEDSTADTCVGDFFYKEDDFVCLSGDFIPLVFSHSGSLFNFGDDVTPMGFL